MWWGGCKVLRVRRIRHRVRVRIHVKVRNRVGVICRCSRIRLHTGLRSPLCFQWSNLTNLNSGAQSVKKNFPSIICPVFAALHGFRLGWGGGRSAPSPPRPGFQSVRADGQSVQIPSSVTTPRSLQRGMMPVLAPLLSLFLVGHLQDAKSACFCHIFLSTIDKTANPPFFVTFPYRPPTKR